MLIYLLILCIGPCKSWFQPMNPACQLKINEMVEDFEYIQDGDIIIGGLLTPQYYRQLVEFLLAIEEINNHSPLLPNMTLGYHIYDSCGHEQKTVKSIFQILSYTMQPVPNYSCNGKQKLCGFIGDLTSDTTIISAQILSVLGFSQISYGASDPSLSDRFAFPYFFRTLQSFYVSSLAVSKLLRHFGWTWVGIIRFDYDSGENELQSLTGYFSRDGICVEFTIKISHYFDEMSHDNHIYINRIKEIIHKSTTNIIVVCGKLSATGLYKLMRLKDELVIKTLIFSPSTSIVSNTGKQFLSLLDGSLILEQNPQYPREFSQELLDFMNSFHPFVDVEDRLLEDILLLKFKCSSKDLYKNQLYGHLYATYFKNCTYEDFTEAFAFLINSILTVQSPHVHLAIPRAQCAESCQPGYRKALNPGAQPCCYECVRCSEGEISNRTNSEKCLRCPDLEWPDEYNTICITKAEEYLSFTNDNTAAFLSSIQVLFFLISLQMLRIFITYRDTPIVRANNRSLSFLLLVSIKLSFLSVFLFLGRPVDITCMLRNITFGITFSIAVSSLLAKTIMVCVAFKATKPGSSWRKWVGVKLSNSVVLFCSSIQIIICMTWLAISPPFQELDLHTYPGTIIIQCNEGSAIGFYSVIGYMGLLAACNETIGFYIVLSYMGLLASVSFIVAFLARTLPDSFNEAKYITFSMLLFCSVWITMIPAYLSTKGKYMVAVEIFAIISSSCGLLFCIFLPKCYIILLKPEMNTKQYLLGNNK
ncbi:hypothetical protein XELAEV_18004476mg [Xenopus laevis]|uniref:G-protein coupled receptors family 3 profile domain-containing protein n=1 Tax=Xenopus laevis TaxID=8355 RepID=A0A974GZV5_XENLA|nr:hypothetical protein XELAEV_18004476mg [Xenopus laevis]